MRVLFDAGNLWQFIPDRFRVLMKTRFDRVFLEHEHLNDAIRGWLARWADVIFVDWALSWAQFYLENFPDKRIIIRTHRADVWHTESPFYQWENADAILFMSNFYRQEFLRQSRIQTLEDLSEKCITVPRLIDDEYWKFHHDLKGKRVFGKNLGMLGRIVPWKGCKEIAALMETELRGFSLSLKGLTEDDIMLHENYVQATRGMKGDIKILEHTMGETVKKWYADVDFIISNSSVESWHAVITEGMFCGCVPLIRHWPGAEQMHPEEFIYEDLPELVERVKTLAGAKATKVISDVTPLYQERKKLSDRMRQWCLQRYALKDVAALYADIIEGKDVPLDMNPKDIIPFQKREAGQ